MSYVLKTIEATLDPDSIQKAIEEVQKFQKLLKPAMQSLIDYLTEKGVEFAKLTLLMFDEPAFRTGALRESIAGKVGDGEATISAGEGLTNAMGEPTNYAIYVEYGNGYTRPEGWWYPDPNGWWTPKKYGAAGQPMSWTRGMYPRPFMMNTYLTLKDMARANGGKIIAEYIADHKE